MFVCALCLRSFYLHRTLKKVWATSGLLNVSCFSTCVYIWQCMHYTEGYTIWELAQCRLQCKSTHCISGHAHWCDVQRTAHTLHCKITPDTAHNVHAALCARFVPLIVNGTNLYFILQFLSSHFVQAPSNSSRALSSTAFSMSSFMFYSLGFTK